MKIWLTVTTYDGRREIINTFMNDGIMNDHHSNKQPPYDCVGKRMAATHPELCRYPNDSEDTSELKRRWFEQNVAVVEVQATKKQPTTPVISERPSAKN
jgi:hypothetical protein